MQYNTHAINHTTSNTTPILNQYNTNTIPIQYQCNVNTINNTMNNTIINGSNLTNCYQFFFLNFINLSYSIQFIIICNLLKIYNHIPIQYLYYIHMSESILSNSFPHILIFVLHIQFLFI